MPFIRITIGKHEWGFNVSDGFIPAVGDRITLWHAPPDEYGNDMIDGTVVGRKWDFAPDVTEYEELDLIVNLDSPVPNGHIADSSEWPSEKDSERRAAFLDELANIKRGT